jgi:hypothetical protein
MGLENGPQPLSWHHTMVFQAEVYVIKACIMENTENSYIGRNIYMVFDSQAAMTTPDNSKINSKFVWDFHQLLVKLAEGNKIQLVWVLGKR